MKLLLVTAPFGVKYTVMELKNLIGIEARPLESNLLEFESKDILYDLISITLLSKTVKRIMIELERAPFEDISDLYDIAKSINWDMYLHTQTSFAVRAVDIGFTSMHTFPRKEIEKIVGQGVVDSFLESTGKRPPVKLVEPDIEIYAFIRDNEVILGLDVSGYNLNSDEEILARSLVVESQWDYKEEGFIEVLSGGLSQSAWDYATRTPFRSKAAKINFIKTKLLDKKKFLDILKQEWSRKIKPQIVCFERAERIDIIKKDFFDYRLVQLKPLEDFDIKNGVIGSNMIIADPRKEGEINILRKILNKLVEDNKWRKAVFCVRLDVIDIFKNYFGNDTEKSEEGKEKVQTIYGPNVKIKGIEGKIISLLRVD